MKPFSAKRFWFWQGLLFVSTCFAFFFSLRIGYEKIPLADYFHLIIDHVTNQISEEQEIRNTIIFAVRLPRVLLSFIVGMALSVSGVVLQSLFRNPLAEPHLTGVSSGASLGATLAVFIAAALGVSHVFLQPFCAFLGSLFAIILVYLLASKKGKVSVYSLLLFGVILNSLFVSIIIFMQSLMNPYELSGTFHWLLGNLSLMNPALVSVVSVIVLVCVSLLFRFGRDLNLFCFGEDVARSCGVRVEITKRKLFFIIALLTGVTVSVSGMIGFVGLVVPHIARRMFGLDHRMLLATSAWLGGILLLVADSLARTMFAPQEISVGVLTALIGAPCFIVLLLRQKQEGRVL